MEAWRISFKTCIKINQICFYILKLSFVILSFCICKWNPPPPLGDFCRHVSFQSFTQGYLKNACLNLIGWWGWLCRNILFLSKESQVTHTKRWGNLFWNTITDKTNTQLLIVIFNLICKSKFSTLLLSSKNYYCACHKVKRNICKIVDDSAFTTVKTFVNKPFANLIPFINLADVC